MLYVVIAVLLGVAVIARITNPNRRKNIDANIIKLVNAKDELVIKVPHASEDLEKEYKNQLRGYKGAYQCYRNPENPTTLVLAKL